ncbi:MAG: DegT/DnrJ/EryC1/StrS family aminotransferase [Gemmatimonadetes bacterium]|nr:DegT/DnrJ/EryC1/StrS family aminotransferase [Gemmatimonadota bacterium]
MPVPLLDLQAQYATMQSELDEAVLGVVRSQRFILGEVVERFEAEVARLVGVKHAVACASGTDAILLVLRALALEPGDEVIVPPFTFFATAGAVWNAGLRPVFADIEPDTFNLNADAVAAALTDRTRAVVAVHLFGQMADLGALRRLAHEHGLALIEDAAQAIGARQRIEGKETNAGAVGAAGCFSFFPSKNLGGFGDGGLVTTRDDRLAAVLRKLRVHGGQQMYHHELVGTNSRLDALQAAVLLAKLPRLAGWTEARRRNAGWYDRALAPAPHVRTPTSRSENYHVYHQYTVRAQRRDRLKAHLDRHGIGNAIYYPVPLHLQECFASLGYRRGDFPESERAAGEVLSLPVYPELTDAQRGEVVGRVSEVYERD